MPCRPQICDGLFYLRVGGRADKALERPPCLRVALDHSGWRRSTRGKREKNILEVWVSPVGPTRQVAGC
eukprot:11171042-Lingulodinium_polyedra.AAC.1